MKIKDCTTSSDMLGNFLLFQQLNPDFTPEKYARYIADVTKDSTYGQAALVNDSGIRIAMIAYQKHPFAGESWLYVRDFITDEKFRGKCLGNELLKWIEQIKCPELDCAKLYLHTYSDQTDHPLSKLEQHYAASGYKAGGIWMHKDSPREVNTEKSSTSAASSPALSPRAERIAALTSENAALRARLRELESPAPHPITATPPRLSLLNRVTESQAQHAHAASNNR